MGNPSAVPRFVKVLIAVAGVVFLFVAVLAMAGAAWYGMSKKHARTMEPATSDSVAASTLVAENDANGDGQAPRHRSSGAARPPVKVEPFRGQYCSSMGPPGWAVIAENPQRSAFGADFASSDGLTFAGYSIFPGGTLAPQGFETPGRAVAATLTGFGTVQVRFSNPRQLAQNVYMIEYQSPTNHGVAFYQVIPAGGGGFMIVMRTAGTGVSPGQWEKRAAEAMAVARSLRCQVPFVPPSPDPPGLNSKPSSRSDEGDESDTLYNRWLEREYYHNPETGENYWVSPSENYSQTGPDGPGYYATYGNSIIKLSPGYTQ